MKGVYENYSSIMAPVGQMSKHVPQSSQAMVILKISPSSMALCGQESKQVPQAIHSSVIL